MQVFRRDYQLQLQFVEESTAAASSSSSSLNSESISQLCLYISLPARMAGPSLPPPQLQPSALKATLEEGGALLSLSYTPSTSQQQQQQQQHESGAAAAAEQDFHIKVRLPFSCRCLPIQQETSGTSSAPAALLVRPADRLLGVSLAPLPPANQQAAAALQELAEATRGVEAEAQLEQQKLQALQRFLSHTPIHQQSADQGSQPWLLAQALSSSPASSSSSSTSSNPAAGGSAPQPLKPSPSPAGVAEDEELPEDRFLRTDALSLYYLQQREEEKKRMAEKAAAAQAARAGSATAAAGAAAPPSLSAHATPAELLAGTAGASQEAGGSALPSVQPLLPSHTAVTSTSPESTAARGVQVQLEQSSLHAAAELSSLRSSAVLDLF